LTLFPGWLAKYTLDGPEQRLNALTNPLKNSGFQRFFVAMM
jgi:hypothetical protein